MQFVWPFWVTVGLTSAAAVAAILRFYTVHGQEAIRLLTTRRYRVVIVVSGIMVAVGITIGQYRWYGTVSGDGLVAGFTFWVSAGILTWLLLNRHGRIGK
ncbi:MAG: hypothetical protein M3R24_28015 [Chloroflexota bacterium]|nr:hypothetical protein [Chloroflexota bacterium]